MNKPTTHEVVESALEAAIEALSIIATDEKLDRRLLEVQKQCNAALEELRGYPHELPKEEWRE